MISEIFSAMVRPHRRIGMIINAVAILVFVNTADFAPDTPEQFHVSVVGIIVTVTLLAYARFDMHRRFKKREAILRRLHSIG
jgi:hypothetical protein